MSLASLLRGAFEGQNLITVNTKTVGDQDQLDFPGSVETEAELEPVGAGAGTASKS